MTTTRHLICPICRQKITPNMGSCMRRVRGEVRRVHQACQEEPREESESPSKE